MYRLLQICCFALMLSISTLSSAAHAAGPGQALDFDGIDDRVEIGDDPKLDLSSRGTLEAWILVEKPSDNATILHKGDGINGETYSLRFGAGAQGNRVRLVLNNGTHAEELVSTTGLAPGKWYHIAAAWKIPGNMTLYINGVRDATRPTRYGARNSDRSLLIGAYDTTGAYGFSGRIDEVRIWNTERGIDAIRAGMCRTLDPAEEPHLQGAWRFDETHGDICTDNSYNANDGKLSGMNPVRDRVDSGAAIGDASTYIYSDTGQINLSHPDGDRMTLSDITGGPDGVQLYRVDAPPARTTAPHLWKSFAAARRYWGVFVTGGTAPTYTLSYNYAGCPGIIEEDRLVMGYRKNNGDTWKDLDAALDTEANTLSRKGLSGTEYILGEKVAPRNAMAFGGPGTSEHVRVTENSDFDLGTNGTIEAWVRIDGFHDASGIIYRGHSANGDAYELAFGTGPDNSRVEFTINDGAGSSVEQSTTSLSAGQWYHIAGVWDNDGLDGDDRMELFVNGILEDATAPPRTPRAGDTLNIGAHRDGTDTMEGAVDEVRIWNTDRSANDIRDTMCRKIARTGTDLLGYWRFDRGRTDDAHCIDYTGNANTGVMSGFSEDTGRVCSSAPIGDASAHDYTGQTPAPPEFSVTLAHPDGDSVSVSGDGGTWTDADSGLQVYRIDEPPAQPQDLGTSSRSVNGLSPPATWASIDYSRHWGVFVTGGTNPSYEFSYRYAGNPNVPATDATLGLAARTDCCDRSWTDTGAALDSADNTLTVSKQTAMEYVLGGTTRPLVSRLKSFTGTRSEDGKCIDLEWKTAVEIDTLGFFLLRSDRRQGPYTRLPGVFIRSEASSATAGAAYRYSDCSVDEDENRVYYYRLEEEDYQSDTPNPAYGPVEVGPQGLGLSENNTGRVTETETGQNSPADAGCFIRGLAP